MKQILYVTAISLGKIRIHQPFEIWICGKEKVTIGNGIDTFTYDFNTGVNNYQRVPYKPYFSTNHAIICPFVSYSLEYPLGSPNPGTTF